jgi:hypothetical protein
MVRSIATLNASAANGIGRSIREALAEVATMLLGSTTFEPQRLIETDVRELVEPHLAILMHKRERFLTPDANGAPRNERWTAELDGFVERSFFWPASAANEAHDKVGRRHLVNLVDRIVVAEQRKRAAMNASLPATSRFDSSWAD